MSICLCKTFLLFSSINACDRCVHQSRVSFFPKAFSLSSGACGYGSLATALYGDHLAAAVPKIYKSGSGCGDCFQVRCKDSSLCTENGTRVIVTDLAQSNQTDFVLSHRAFIGMAKKGMRPYLLKLAVVDVEYKRIPCDYKGQKLAVRVEESSQKPNYLAIKILYQGGQTEITAIDIAEDGSSNWSPMNRIYGAVWDTNRYLAGALQLRLLVISGYDGKWIWANTVLPADWEIKGVYNSPIQIDDIAQEGCSQCDQQIWN
ncbi:expansin-like A1 isoform X2 [Cynara cardunculus var. scolymus]|uniref:expansin-like A1 isoform X2 n=1 Tax=Cynara cardunculus var. scolymus TaxID=59895 RepID=UPI000D627D92|nr:expansin-like A1 isoform X2 [Cynara cardunculus var. scolymus]